jgi:hypothetical protein
MSISVRQPFLVGATRDDSERIARQWRLKRPRLIPRRTHLRDYDQEASAASPAPAGDPHRPSRRPSTRRPWRLPTDRRERSKRCLKQPIQGNHDTAQDNRDTAFTPFPSSERSLALPSTGGTVTSNRSNDVPTGSPISLSGRACSLVTETSSSSRKPPLPPAVSVAFFVNAQLCLGLYSRVAHPSNKRWADHSRESLRSPSKTSKVSSKSGFKAAKTPWALKCSPQKGSLWMMRRGSASRINILYIRCYIRLCPNLAVTARSMSQPLVGYP